MEKEREREREIKVVICIDVQFKLVLLNDSNKGTQKEHSLTSSGQQIHPDLITD